MSQTTHTLTRPLSQHLSDCGITFEDLQCDLTVVFKYTLNEAAAIIVSAWQEGELDDLMYEAGIGCYA